MSFVDLTTRSVRDPEVGRTLTAVARRRPPLSPAGLEFLRVLRQHCAG